MPLPPANSMFMIDPLSIEAEAVRARLMLAIADDEHLPALGIAVAKVIELASSSDEAVHDLAAYVLTDVALTQKILRVANTVQYRALGGGPVTTVSRAIFLLGFDTVKTVALALLVVEGLSQSRAQGVRRELAVALCASIVGREIARRSPYRDPEEASVAALFKNLGRVLVATHDPDSYKTIMTLIDGRTHTPVQAAIQVLGVNFDALSESVLKDWKIPDSIVFALGNPASGVLRPAKTRQEWLQQVASFSTAAATLILRSQAPADDAACRALLLRFGDALGVDEVRLAQLFNDVRAETRVLLAQIDEDAALSLDLEAAPDTVNGLPRELLLSASLVGIDDDKRHPSGKPVNASTLLMTGVQDVNDMIASGSYKLNELITLVLETLYRGMGFRFATVCLRDAKSESYKARVSLGERFAAVHSGFQFPVAGTRNVFHLALDNNADVVISDAQDVKVADLIPAWHRRLLPDARSFVILPLVVQRKPLGLFYADRNVRAEEGISTEETGVIRMLKSQVLTVLNARQP